MNRPRILVVALAAPALAVAVAVADAPSASAQTITGFYCSTAVPVPGTTGTFRACATFALSALTAGPVSKPVTCRLINTTGATLAWYRAAWVGGGNGYEVDAMTISGSIGQGTYDVNCNAALPTWLFRNTHNYQRSSVKVAGHDYGTAGANAYSP